MVVPKLVISYRIADGTKQAFELAKRLVSSGQPIFWDRWSLPRRLAERRELIDDTTLNDYLCEKISAARMVWGVDSPLYAEKGSYSLIEQDLASSLNKFELVSDFG